MKEYLKYGLVMLASVGFVSMASPLAAQYAPTRYPKPSAGPVNYPTQISANLTRPCTAAAGHGDQLSVSSSDGTGELSPNSRYRFICTVDVRCEAGDSANPTADSSSPLLIKANKVEYLSTGEGFSQYYSCVDVDAASGTCDLVECI